MVTAYTDGACLKNPGPGGWAYRILFGDRNIEGSGGAVSTTNNRMELQAVIEVLKLTEPRPLTIWSDSQYVVKGASSWLAGWKRKGWKRGKDPLKNADQWREIDSLLANRQVTFRWCRGHDGNTHNERVDSLATSAAKAIRCLA